MGEPKYKRVLLKISGEALAGEAHRGLDFNVIGGVCDVVRKCVELGVQVGIVVGGGNFWRGVKDGGGKMERTRADHMGMLATVINCLAVAASPNRVFTRNQLLFYEPARVYVFFHTGPAAEPLDLPKIFPA